MYLMFKRLRLLLYRLLSVPPNVGYSTVRFFRFNLPFVLKKSEGNASTEADALRFLNGHFRGNNRLPIPILYDSLFLDGSTYTLMSKLPGRTILQARQEGIIPSTDEYFRMICHEIALIFRRVWALPQPSQFKGKVMISASGHGMITDINDGHGLIGPFSSPLAYYAFTTRCINQEDLLQRFPEAERVFNADHLVFAHTDPYLQNILVSDDGHVTGILDWENAGWLPMATQWSDLRHMHQCASRAYTQAWYDTMELSPETLAAVDLAAKISASNPI